MRGAFDTHSHLQDAKLLDDFERVLDSALDAGLSGIALCGYDVASNDLALTLSARSEVLYPTVGFHPHEADDITENMLAELEVLAKLPEVVAIGEIGLDFYRNLSTEANQRRLIEAQLGIALTVEKPVSIHSRSAEDTIAEHLLPFATSARAAGLEVPGVMHCFGGTIEQARPYLEAGFLISIACPVTYPNNHETRRLATSLPLEALVIETDSPYLPPQTRRGQLNEPANVLEAARAIAGLRRETLAHVIEVTTANAARLFRVPIREAAVAR